MERLYYFVFSNFFGIGPERFGKLLAFFGSANKAYKADFKKLEKIFGRKTAEKFEDFRNKFDIVKELEKCRKKKIRVVALCDKDYPESLKNIPDPPICLYVKGDWESFDFQKGLYFGIVGTRQPTDYGRQVAFSFAKELAKVGFCIVSGMALGIDSAAHKGALQAEGKTIAVLGCGVDIVYPALNRPLYNKILEKGGLVVSEFPPGTTVQKGLFVARNRIISGLSKGVLVVEGGETSGSLITARYAAEQGRDVFAVPGRIFDRQAKAPNLLIKQGARLVEEAEEIVREYLPEVKMAGEKRALLSPEEEKILSAFDGRACELEQLRIKTKLPISRLLSLLSMLEIKGVVRVEGEKVVVND